MFDIILDDVVAAPGAAPGDAPPEQAPLSHCAPSGWLALELDTSTACPGRLDDSTLIESIIAFERLASWAAARQARLLAKFAVRRPSDDADGDALRCGRPSAASPYAADEVGLALRLSRTTASARLRQAILLVDELGEALEAWERGRIDGAKARAIVEASLLLSGEQRRELARRVLPRAGQQTLAQLRAALARGVLSIDPEGAEARHRQAHADPRVEVGPYGDGDGMASLWALLSASDATAAYQNLCELARGLGADDPRGMDARRADLLVELLTGQCCVIGSRATGGRENGCDHDCEPDERDVADDGAGDQAVGDGEVSPGGSEVAGLAAAASAAADLADGGTGGRADAVTRRREVASGRHSTGDCAGRHALGWSRSLVHVTVPITMLLGLDEQAGELAGFGPIPASLARELAAQGTWRRLLTDPASGVLLDLGRSTYTPPAALARFVRSRNSCCRFPTCRQMAAGADLDHAVPYEQGGATDQNNLYASCRHHHRLKTTPWAGTSPNTPTGRSPTGPPPGMPTPAGPTTTELIRTRQSRWREEGPGISPGEPERSPGSRRYPTPLSRRRSRSRAGSRAPPSPAPGRTARRGRRAAPQRAPAGTRSSWRPA